MMQFPCLVAAARFEHVEKGKERRWLLRALDVVSYLDCQKRLITASPLWQLLFAVVACSLAPAACTGTCRLHWHLPSTAMALLGRTILLSA